MKKLLFLFCLLPFFASAQIVMSVHDGDSYKIRTIESEWIRVAGIDCPEIISNYVTESQPMGREIGDSVRSFLKSQTVEMVRYEPDVYGRPLVTIRYNGQDVAEYLLLKGWAWYVPNKRKSLFKKQILSVGLRTTYANAEKYAKKNKLGIWADKKAVSPSVWRETHRRVSALSGEGFNY